LESITADDIRDFLVHLSSHPVAPAGIAARPARTLSKKTIRNTHTGLSSLWTWAVKEGIVAHHVVRAVSAPRAEKPAIEPFSKDDVVAMLRACERSAPYTRPGKQECSHTRPTAARDRAILLLLLDTGARASEVFADPKKGTPGLSIQDVDKRNRCIKVMGKGDKERIIKISPETSKAIWRYLLERRGAEPTEPLFLSRKGGSLTTAGLLRLVKRLGERAGVSNAYPHRFRHTFAVNFLRNGGNTFELQHLLGHSSLEMVRRYVNIAQVDIENAHRRASPVSNWQL
jgi:site-specific recombinase XerD